MEEVIREAASNAVAEQLKDFDWLEAWPGNPAGPAMAVVAAVRIDRDRAVRLSLA